MHVQADKFANHIVLRLMRDYERSGNMHHLHAEVHSICMHYPRLEPHIMELLQSKVSDFRINDVQRDLKRERTRNAHDARVRKKRLHGNC